MKCSPALSRYRVSLKSITSPGADCLTEFCSVVLSCPTLDMSISPRIRATGLPSWSSKWTSASIGVPRKRSPQFDGGAGRLAAHGHVVHQRLHQLQPASAILPARRSPGPVVAHAHGHVVLAAQGLEVE